MAKRHAITEEPQVEPELPENLLDIRDVAKRLGVGRDKIFALMKNEGLPYIKWGERTLKFHPTAVARWLESQSQNQSSAS
jgi:excisionase family DNA binding protein